MKRVMRSMKITMKMKNNGGGRWRSVLKLLKS